MMMTTRPLTFATMSDESKLPKTVDAEVAPEENNTKLEVYNPRVAAAAVLGNDDDTGLANPVVTTPCHLGIINPL